MTIFPKNEEWYTPSSQYWSQIEATTNGMLGGYENLHDADSMQSRNFIRKRVATTGGNYACDCGAGIGRVAQYTLAPFYTHIDLVEQNKEFLNTAREKRINNVQEYFQVGLQDFTPVKDRYDLIWIQWVLNYLTDPDLISLLQRCAQNIKPGGWIGIKENIAHPGTQSGYLWDKADTSVTRTEEIFQSIFTKAGLKSVAVENQNGWSADMLAVKMFALIPL